VVFSLTTAGTANTANKRTTKTTEGDRRKCRASAEQIPLGCRVRKGTELVEKINLEKAVDHSGHGEQREASLKRDSGKTRTYRGLFDYPLGG